MSATFPRAQALRVSEIWRYPVKSLRGEQLAHTRVTADGVAGDRLVHVADSGGLLTGRTRHRLLSLDARTGPTGQPLVTGRPWDSPEAAAAVREAAGPDARLVADPASARFDILPLLVLTRAEADALDIDLRRLRPNIVIDGALPEQERDWPGRALRIGTTVIGVHSLRPRCVVTTIDPDTGEQDLEVFRRIRRQRDASLALNCWILQPGQLSVGDDVEVLDVPPLPDQRAMPSPGGWVTGAPYRRSPHESPVT